MRKFKELSFKEKAAVVILTIVASLFVLITTITLFAGLIAILTR